MAGGHEGPGPFIGFFPWRDALRRVRLWGRGSVRVPAAMTEHGPPSEGAAMRDRGLSAKESADPCTPEAGT